jgi:hypothetical protein
MIGDHQMSLFDSAVNSISSAAQSIGSNPVAAFGQLGSIANAGQQLAGALNSLSNPANLLSKIRSISLPAGGNIAGKIVASSAVFGGTDASTDWRVRLTVPGGTIFDSSSVFAPLKAAGGLVFPYTPTINITNSAKYDTVSPVHNNYPFQAYSGSQPDSIQITAPFYVQDSVEAAYWIAAVHFLRSATKMFSGDSYPAGNPPVILALNGYGEYVFKNVPVVVTNFSVSLDASSDYISTSAAGGGGGGSGLSGALSNIAGTASRISSLTGGLAAVNQIANIAGAASGALGAVNSFLNGSGLGGGTAGGASHVPTKSSFTVTLAPAYSRESVKTFSLQRFVNGDYMTSSGAGYI